MIHSLVVMGLVQNLCYAESASPAGESDAAYQEAIKLREQGRFEDAEHQLLRALEEEPGNADYHFELANVYAATYDQWNQTAKSLAQKKLDQAAYEFSQVTMIRPDFVAAHYNLGVILKNRGDFEKAREKFRKVLELDSTSSAAWMQIGASYEAQGFFDEASDAYKNTSQLKHY